MGGRTIAWQEDATTVTLAGSPASAATAIPTNSDGKVAQRILVSVYLAAGNGAAYIKPGQSGDTIAVGEGALLQQGDSLEIAVRGASHLISFGAAGSETLNIVPLE